MDMLQNLITADIILLLTAALVPSQSVSIVTFSSSSGQVSEVALAILTVIEHYLTVKTTV